MGDIIGIILDFNKNNLSQIVNFVFNPYNIWLVLIIPPIFS